MNENVYTFAAIVTAIFLEAMPFLAVGALLSAAIEVFVPAERLMRSIPRGILAGIGLGVAAGLVLPTCECGVVPVVRRLIRKGVPPHVAVAYMLAAPIVNPVVLASTWFAFQGDLRMLGGRVLIAVVTAGAIGWVAYRMGTVLRKTDAPEDPCPCGHDDHDEHGHNQGTVAQKLREVLRHGAQEFIDMGKFLILGAMAAGLFKTFLPHAILTAFTGNPVLQISGMMLLAVLLSVCSEADAFVAASFQSFSPASQLAFVTLGPMIDLKLIGMFAVTFNRRFMTVLLIGPTLMVFLLSLLFEVLL